MAAGGGAKVEKFAPFPERNGKRLVHVHATDGITHQSASRNRSRNPDRGIRGMGRGILLIAKHTANDTAQEPHTPGNDEQPKQKFRDASEKVHLNDCLLNGPRCLITPLTP